MIRVFLSHEPEASENFYCERAQEEPNEVAKGRNNDNGPVLSTDMLVGGARGRDVEISFVTVHSPRPLPKWFGPPNSSPISLERAEYDYGKSSDRRLARPPPLSRCGN